MFDDCKGIKLGINKRKIMKETNKKEISILVTIVSVSICISTNSIRGFSYRE